MDYNFNLTKNYRNNTQKTGVDYIFNARAITMGTIFARGIYKVRKRKFVPHRLISIEDCKEVILKVDRDDFLRMIEDGILIPVCSANVVVQRLYFDKVSEFRMNNYGNK